MRERETALLTPLNALFAGQRTVCKVEPTFDEKKAVEAASLTGLACVTQTGAVPAVHRL